MAPLVFSLLFLKKKKKKKKKGNQINKFYL